MTQSATVFAQESAQANSQRKDLQTVLELLRTGDFQQFRAVWTPKFEELSEAMTSDTGDVSADESASQRLLVLDLKMHFWFLSREVKQSPNNDHSLSPEIKEFFAEYLQCRADRLTQVQSLAKYFTIPYIKAPGTHAIFIESFSEGWFESVCQQLERIWLNQSARTSQSTPTTLETCIANFSKHQSGPEFALPKSQLGPQIKLHSANDRCMVIKSTENRKLIDMLSRRESLSIGRVDVSEVQSSSFSEVLETRRKLLEYKLLLKQKEHHMRKKDWESKECLEKSHQKWIYFVKYL